MADADGSVLRFLTCGSVDDGKSTLIGHLLFLTGNLYEDQIATLADESRRIGNAGELVDYSLLMDGLLSEREQGITIDVAYRYFNTPRRKYIVADTPGHEQYTRNMATGASGCDAAIILVDAKNGVLAQTRRHALICGLLGIRSVLFAINKMDAVGWSGERYAELRAECGRIIADLVTLGLAAPAWTAAPVSALHGDNLAVLSEKAPWFSGPTVLDWLESVPGRQVPVAAPFRFAVRYVIRPGGQADNWQAGEPLAAGARAANYRAYAGRVLGGSVARGNDVVILPSGRTSRVAGLRGAAGALECAQAGMSVSVELEDQVDVARGDGFFAPDARPELSDQFKAWIVWMQDEALHPGRSYAFKSVFGNTLAEVTHLNDRLDPGSYHRLAAQELGLNEIGEAHLSLARPVPFDPYTENSACGSFILVDRVTNATAGCGMIVHGLRRAQNVHWQSLAVDRAARQRLLGQTARVLWFTGLSGSGKSTIADALEKRLHAAGRLTMLLDGDNVRHGLCRDLGFTEADRIENIRRVGEVARLFVSAGVIVLACFISPYRADRHMVRALFDGDEFVEVFVDTPLATCERRDPKGLYAKARRGEIPNFTGINAPYEAPLAAELVIPAGETGVEEAVELIMARISV